MCSWPLDFFIVFMFVSGCKNTVGSTLLQTALGRCHSQSLVKAVIASSDVFLGSLLMGIQGEPNVKKIMIPFFEKLTFK